jgi:hypothetical protein
MSNRAHGRSKSSVRRAKRHVQQTLSKSTTQPSRFFGGTTLAILGGASVLGSGGFWLWKMLSARKLMQAAT